MVYFEDWCQGGVDFCKSYDISVRQIVVCICGYDKDSFGVIGKVQWQCEIICGILCF